MRMEVASMFAKSITDDERAGELVDQQWVGGSHQIAKKDLERRPVARQAAQAAPRLKDARQRQQ